MVQRKGHHWVWGWDDMGCMVSILALKSWLDFETGAALMMERVVRVSGLHGYRLESRTDFERQFSLFSVVLGIKLRSLHWQVLFYLLTTSVGI